MISPLGAMISPLGAMISPLGRVAAGLLLTTALAAAALDTFAELPAPDLSGVEPAVRAQLEAAQLEAATALGDPAADPANRAQKVGSLGRLYLLYSLLDSAAGCFETALASEAGDPRWSYYLGVLRQRQGRFEDAAEHLAAAAEARPRDLPTLLRLGQVEVGRDRPATAAAYFQRALELEPASAAGLYGLAQVAAREGDLDQAERLFSNVLEAQPTASTAHYQLGLVLRRRGDLERARTHLERRGRGEVVFPDPLMDQLGGLARGAAVRIAQATRAAGRGDLATARATLESAVAADPDNLTARLALASNLIRQNRIEDAVAELHRVLERDPQNASAHYNLGTAAARRDDFDTAIDHLHQATELAPGFSDAFVNLAELLRDQGRHEEALPALDRAVELEPGNVALELQRAEALHRLGRVEAADTALAAAAARTEGDAALLLLLGQAFEGRGGDDPAAEAYARAAALAGQSEAADAARRLADLRTRQGRHQAASASLDRALELRPDWTVALKQRAALKGRMGRFGEAAADFARVIELEPGDESARMGGGVALLLAESYVEAERHFEQSLEALPESVALRHGLARLLATCPDDRIRDGARALALAQQVAGRQRSVEHGQTIAMALAELGRFEDAVALQRELLGFAESEAPPAALADLRRRLASYRRGEPERAPWLPR